MRLLARGVEDAPALASVHAASFPAPWNAEALASLLASPGVFAMACEDGKVLAGFILLRAVAGEAEVLTLAVAPGHRRQGIGAGLLDASLALAATHGADVAFLEVAEDNRAALALYGRAGFATVGRRGAYYARGGGPPADALVLRKPLARAGA